MADKKVYNLGYVRVTMPNHPDMKNQPAVIKVGGKNLEDVLSGLGGGGTTDYTDLDNKPQINSVELSGNKSESDLGLATSAQGDKADTAYQKPQTGIPESDLSSDIQQALQKHFKGWFNTLAELKAAYTAVEGDSAYVKDASPATTWSIYVYDATATTDNNWADSVTKADTSNVQTFATGEEVNEVSIINDFTTGGTTNVASAKTVKELNNKKLDNSLNDDTFYIVDNLDRAIARIDANGIHSTDYSYKDSDDALADEQGNVSLIAKLTALLQGINSEATTRAEAVGALSSSKLDAEFDGSAFYFTDSEGYIICKIDADGVHAPNIGESTAVDKYKVACMVLGENYYPSAKPTRDSKGFVTNMNVIFETGVSGTIAFTYDTSDTRKKGNISSISVTYGTDSYTITITRDNSGNVNTVSVE